MQRLKKAFLALYATGQPTMEAAALEGAGVDTSTIFRWRQADPLFDRAVLEAQEQVRQIRLAELEDSAFARSVRGEGSAALDIFLLKNYSDGKLKDRHEITGKDGKSLIPVQALHDLLEDDR